MSWKSNLKVSVSGVRGIVGDTFTPALVADFTASFGEYVGGGKVIVGRDTRMTGKMLEHAVISGLLAVGCQPVLLGIVPTPTVLMMVDKLQANGGIVISASHNPVEWNALKFISSSGIFLNYTEAMELLDVYNQPDTTFVLEEDYRNIRNINQAFDEHQSRIFEQIDVEAVRRTGFRVAVDCSNGVGAYYSRNFLEKLGCEVFTVFDETDGKFRRPPEPIPENLGKLCETVCENNCNIGFAQDPDGDRIALVDDRGKAVNEQYTVVIALSHILPRTPGDVVVNIQTTKAAVDVAKSFNCEIHYSKVGEINVIGKMLDVGAVIGGEGSSGGVIWPAVHPCRDSFTSMALVLEMMALQGKTLREIIDKLPEYYIESSKVPCSTENAHQVIKQMKADFADADLITVDGIRLEWEDEWVLIRPSNTEAVLRLTAEAKTSQKANELLNQFSEKVNEILRNNQ